MATTSTSPKKTAKQRWPFVRRREYPSGLTSWTVDARTTTGGKKKVFATKVEAEGFAERCRVTRENEGVSVFGSVELARFGKTVADAVRFYLAHLQSEEQSRPVREAVAELIEVRRRAGRSDGYCRHLRNRLARFEKGHCDVLMTSITSRDLDGWLAGLGVAPGTRNTFRRDLRTLFSFCVKRGYCTVNPAAGTELATQVSAPPGILSVADAKKILASAAGVSMVPYVAIGLFAGLRSAELAKLDWSEIDQESGLIEVTAAKAKTSRRRLVRISDNLKRWLLPHRQTTGPVAPEALRYRWDDVKRAAGFATPGGETEDEEEAGVVLREWPSNALRHSFGSYWLAEHQDAAALALQMGNSPQMVFSHYRELVKPKDAAAFWTILPS